MIKKYVKSFVQIIIDSLFPISNADKLLFSYTPEQASKELPKAPNTPIPYTYSIFAYKNELVTRLVWNIKYKKNIKAVQIGGYALYEKLKNDPSLLIPIPITQKRRNERGYNQCELLVDEILRLDGMNSKIITSKDLLVRTVHRDRQTLKDREERLEDAKNIFSINKEALKIFNSNNSEATKKISIIVIDDVITTGSTMKEAMETLKKAGLVNVMGISLAH